MILRPLAYEPAETTLRKAAEALGMHLSTRGDASRRNRSRAVKKPTKSKAKTPMKKTIKVKAKMTEKPAMGMDMMMPGKKGM